MPLQILQKGPSFGQGALLGLGQGIQSLAANKLQQIQQRNEQNDFARRMINYGYSPEEAGIVSALPIEKRLEGLTYLGQPSGGKGEELQRLAQQQRQSQTQVVSPDQVVTEPTQYAAATKQRAQELQEAQKPKLPSSFDLAQEVRRTAAGLPESYQPISVAEAIKEMKAYGASQQQQKQAAEQIKAINADPEKLKALHEDYANAVKNNEMMELRKPGYTGPAMPYEQAIQKFPGLAPTEQQGPRGFKKPLTESDKIRQQKLEVELRKEQRDIEKIEREMKSEGYKVSEKQRTEINDKAEAAADAREHIKDLSDLYKSGKLDSTALRSFIKEAGWPIDALQNPESAQAQNIIKSFLAQGPTLFGGKVSEGEMNVLLSAIPTLDTNPRGALLMLATMDKYAARQEAQQEGVKDLIKQNKGYIPLDWREQLSDIVKPKFKQINKHFRNEVKEIESLDLPESSFAANVASMLGGKAVSLAGKTFEKAAGAFGATAGGALGGAAAGSIVPGVGTAAGAIGGGLGGLAVHLLGK